MDTVNNCIDNELAKGTSKVIRWTREAQVYLLGLPSIATNLWDKEIDAKGRILVLQVGFQLRDLLSEHIWGITDAADDAEATGVGDGCCETGACGDIHPGEHDRVVDFEEIGDRGAELFCGNVVSDGCCLEMDKGSERKSLRGEAIVDGEFVR